MGLFDKVFRPDKAKESKKVAEGYEGFWRGLSAYRPVFHDWHGEMYEVELVRAAIDVRARHISKLKVEPYGAAKPVLQSHLKQAPNQWQTWSQFLYRLSTILDMQNTAFIVPVFDETMTVVGYYPILPDKCEIVSYKGEPWLRYDFRHGGKAAVEMRLCAVMTKFQYRNDFFGEQNAMDSTAKLIDIANRSIEEAVKESSGYRFWGELANFSKADDLAKERERFTRENLTADAGRGLLLFPNTYRNIHEITPRQYTVNADQRKQIDDNVFRYFGVNDDVLMNKATGDQLDAFFNGCVEPFAIQYSEAQTKATFTERERAHGSGIVATANRLQYMTTSQKINMAQQMLDRGVMSINEARELFNYSVVDGGDLRTIRGEYKNADGDELTGGNTNAGENE